MDRGTDGLRSITHDMRNLLTAVRGHAELALRGIAPAQPAREDVAHVVVVTAALFELVDQLDGNDSSETLVASSLDRTVLGMRRLLDALLPDGVEMELVPDAAGAFVRIPKLRIERVVLNLALNARDAMIDGGTLRIATERVSGDAAEIVVSDTGPGFSDEALEHLFEEGFTTKEDRGGSGHGLAALHGIAGSAGGSITIESEAGTGATVRVRLPLVPGASSPADASALDGEEAAAHEAMGGDDDAPWPPADLTQDRTTTTDEADMTDPQPPEIEEPRPDERAPSEETPPPAEAPQPGDAPDDDEAPGPASAPGSEDAPTPQQASSAGVASAPSAPRKRRKKKR